MQLKPMNYRSRPAYRRLAPLALSAGIVSPLQAQTTADPHQASLPPVTISVSPLRTPLVETGQAATVVDADRLARRSSASLGATLAGEPGVHDSGFGIAAGRPVIRGFDGLRVGVARNGLDLFDASSLSPDHAIADDPSGLQAVEILRGPATLPYGGSAIGGLVNLIADEIPETRLDGVSGRASAALSSGDRGRRAAASLRGGANGWNWTAGAHRRLADDYEIPGQAIAGEPDSASGRLPNSFASTGGASVGISRVGERGLLGLSYSGHGAFYGIPSEEDVSIRMTRRRTELLGVIDDPLPGFESARLRYADSRYAHSEIEGGEGEIATRFENRGREIRLDLTLAPFAGLRGALGLQWKDRRLRVSGEEAYLPDVDTTTSALFWIAERRVGALRLEFGARREWSRLAPVTAAGGAPRSFTSDSLSAAATLPLSSVHRASATLSLASRAPAPEELYADGPHLATGTYEIGDAGLDRERSVNLDLAIARTEGPLRWRAGVYANRFSNYVVGRSTDLDGDGEADRVDMDGHPVHDHDDHEHDAPAGHGHGSDLMRLAWGQDRARFHGIEAQLEYSPAGSPLRLSAFFDLARGRLKDGGPLPRMSPARFGLGARWTHGRLDASLDWVAVRRQARVATLETPTDGYHRVDAEIAWRYGQGDGVTLFVQGRNLLDEPIRLHTSFVKDSVPMPGRSLVAGIRTRF